MADPIVGTCLEREVQALIDVHRLTLLELGAAARLLIAGDIDEVFPLDDRRLLDAANPITPERTFRRDTKHSLARADGQVRNLLAHGPCALIILGGAHDLASTVRRLSNGTCEYLRVATKSVADIAGDGAP